MTLGLVWGAAILVLALRITRRRWRTFHRFDSRRSRRELAEAGAILATSIGAAGAIFLIVLGPTGTGARGLAVGLAWGAFLALLVIIDTEPER